MAQTDVRVKIAPKTDITEPSRYKVVYVNDDVTSMQFVVETLMVFFQHNQEIAMELTEEIHESGNAVVAILPYEIAEQKKEEVIMEARLHGYPLEVLIDKID